MASPVANGIKNKDVETQITWAIDAEKHSNCLLLLENGTAKSIYSSSFAPQPAPVNLQMEAQHLLKELTSPLALFSTAA